MITAICLTTAALQSLALKNISVAHLVRAIRDLSNLLQKSAALKAVSRTIWEEAHLLHVDMYIVWNGDVWNKECLLLILFCGLWHWI